MHDVMTSFSVFDDSFRKCLYNEELSLLISTLKERNISVKFMEDKKYTFLLKDRIVETFSIVKLSCFQ